MYLHGLITKKTLRNSIFCILSVPLPIFLSVYVYSTSSSKSTRFFRHRTRRTSPLAKTAGVSMWIMFLVHFLVRRRVLAILHLITTLYIRILSNLSCLRIATISKKPSIIVTVLDLLSSCKMLVDVSGNLLCFYMHF